MTIQDEMAMELLTMLSPRPAAVVELCADLQVSAPELKRLIRNLNDQSFGVVVGRHDGHKSVWIADKTWANAESAATGYYDRVERNSVF